MLFHFNVIRNGTTGIAAMVDVISINCLQRLIHSTLRGTGKDSSNYGFIAYSDLSDISGTDRLEEVTGGVTGTVFNIINKREIHGSHIEMELEHAPEEY